MTSKKKYIICVSLISTFYPLFEIYFRGPSTTIPLHRTIKQEYIKVVDQIEER